MGRPTIARSIKRRRLDAAGVDNYNDAGHAAIPSCDTATPEDHVVKPQVTISQEEYDRLVKNQKAPRKTVANKKSKR